MKMRRKWIVFVLILISCITFFVFLYFDRWDISVSSLFTRSHSIHYPLSNYVFKNDLEYTNITAVIHTSISLNTTEISLTDLKMLGNVLSWPLPTKNVSVVDEATAAAQSSCILSPHVELRVGDILNVTVIAKNARGQLKTYGGDFFQAKLFNSETKASLFGLVTDHYNGTYTVQLPLLWPGPARVAVRLVHSSEAVQVLARHRELQPNKVFFLGLFREQGTEEKVACNAQRSEWLLNGAACCCEFREPVSGEVWLCRKPPSLPCSAWVSHSFGGYQAQLSNLETKLLKSDFTNVIVPGCEAVINVLPRQSSTGKGKRKKCIPGLETQVPAGFYHQDQWTSLVCESQIFSSASQVSVCLRDKQILMMGDSTLRQWFEYLVQHVPSLKLLNLFTSAKSGPFEAVDTDSNIRLEWRAHGLPLRTSETPRADLHYIAAELQGVAGGEHTVVVFTIWAHFTTHPLSLYVRRLANIRRAVVALLQRAPRTLVVIKTANTGYKDVYGSDWLSWQLDCVLRVMFKSLPVVILDVWQMTSCHYSPDNIHPPPEVIRNEVDLFLSFVCPK